jgi:hypothetical protein
MVAFEFRLQSEEKKKYGGQGRTVILFLDKNKLMKKEV